MGLNEPHAAMPLPAASHLKLPSQKDTQLTYLVMHPARLLRDIAQHAAFMMRAPAHVMSNQNQSALPSIKQLRGKRFSYRYNCDYYTMIAINPDRTARQARATSIYGNTLHGKTPCFTTQPRCHCMPT
jgi:hypothetical protein